MKKFFALVLAIMMVMSLALPAAAAEGEVPTYTITVNGKYAGRTLEAYQIFSGTMEELEKEVVSGDTVTTTKTLVLTNIEWGSGVNHTDKIYNDMTLLEALKADTTAFTHKSVETNFKTLFANATTADHIANVMREFADNSHIVDLFADIVGKYLYTGEEANKNLSDPKNSTATTGHYEAVEKFTGEGTDKKSTLTYEIEVPGGYYLIKDQSESMNNKDTFYTKYMLQVSKDITVTVKGEVPSVSKQVSELGDIYKEAMSKAVEKTYHYRWEGKLPGNIAEYDEYYYKFIDTLPKGVVLDMRDAEGNETNNITNAIVSVQIISDSGAAESLKIKLPAQTSEDGKTDNGYVAAVSDPDVNGKTTFTLEWQDLKKAYNEATDDPNAELLPSDKIIVIYKAKLTKDASFTTTGNINEVKLEFSNEPNGDGHGITVPDDATTFTYGLNLLKQAEDTKKYLAGAEFRLYHKITQGDGRTINEYAILEKVVGENGEPILDKERVVYNITGWTTEEEEAGDKLVTVANANGLLIKGLDNEITYYLKETKAPAGYNLPDEDTYFSIHAKYTENPETGKITVHDVYCRVNGVDPQDEPDAEDLATGAEMIVQVTVVNNAGTTLPSTGGMGTTLFYVIGSVLVMGALVMLITKKRMAAEN